MNEEIFGTTWKFRQRYSENSRRQKCYKCRRMLWINAGDICIDCRWELFK